MRAALLLVLALAQLPYARQALDLGRTRDDALFEAFNRGYELTGGEAPDRADILRAEIVTEFRRAVLIVREHANLGEYGYSAQDLTRAMAPHDGTITFIVEARLHPLHTYANTPSYEIYVETGDTTKPLAAKPFKRDPVYPPGAGPGSSLTGVRLEGTFPRAGIEAAAAPYLVVTDDRADVLWRTRIDLSRYR